MGPGALIWRAQALPWVGRKAGGMTVETVAGGDVSEPRDTVLKTYK